MPVPLPCVNVPGLPPILTGAVLDNSTEFGLVLAEVASLKLALADTAIGLGAAAGVAVANALKTKAITTKISLSNRGVAIGVKSATAGNSVAVNQAVITRRNVLSGPTDQFPVPVTPPGI